MVAATAETWSKTKYIVQSRVVSKGVPADRAPWQRMPKLFDDMYQAIMFRERYEAFVRNGKFDGPGDDDIEAAMNDLVGIVVALIKEDGGAIETRILKRTITDEVIEDVQKVQLG